MSASQPDVSRTASQPGYAVSQPLPARDNEHGQGTRNHGRAKHDLNSHSENAASTEKTQAGLVYQVDGSAQFLLATGTPSRQPLAVLNGVTPGIQTYQVLDIPHARPTCSHCSPLGEDEKTIVPHSMSQLSSTLFTQHHKRSCIFLKPYARPPSPGTPTNPATVRRAERTLAELHVQLSSARADLTSKVRTFLSIDFEWKTNIKRDQVLTEFGFCFVDGDWIEAGHLSLRDPPPRPPDGDPRLSAGWKHDEHPFVYGTTRVLANDDFQPAIRTVLKAFADRGPLLIGLWDRGNDQIKLDDVWPRGLGSSWKDVAGAGPDQSETALLVADVQLLAGACRGHHAMRSGLVATAAGRGLFCPCLEDLAHNAGNDAVLTAVLFQDLIKRGAIA